MRLASPRIRGEPKRKAFPVHPMIIVLIFTAGILYGAIFGYCIGRTPDEKVGS